MKLNHRKLVENLFLNRHIKVIDKTSTLSQGVNLPTANVIIKGTTQYKTGVGFIENKEVQIKQMIGRSGRSQYAF